MDISLRGELWDNDSADVLRFWGWRDITAPMDIQAALEAAGIARETLDGVHSPIGLSIGAQTPAEIAVAIMAQIIAIQHGKQK